jgi:tryptophan 2,3-dioxygenase
MTPLQFNSFRDRLGESSGFQSAQFREVEALLGRRDKRAAAHLLASDRARVEHWMSQPSLWDCVLRYVDLRGFKIPLAILIELHRSDPEAALVFERLVDIDEGLQEWRYRHVKMVERTIGRKVGTGGSSGADYLRATLFQPVFPDLWEIRSSF